MSPGMSALNSIGITQSIAIVLVLATVAAGVIGLFWHYILPGAIIIGVVSLFLVLPEDKPKPVTEIVEIEVEKPVEKSVETIEETKKPLDEHEAFIQDCVNIAEYSVKKCEKLWAHRMDNEENVRNGGEIIEDVKFKKPKEVKLLQVDNKEYNRKRAEALKKPNAVVYQATYH